MSDPQEPRGRRPLPGAPPPTRTSVDRAALRSLRLRLLAQAGVFDEPGTEADAHPEADRALGAVGRSR